MFATRVMRMVVTKTSTGIVGLEVNPNARQDLIQLYTKTLKKLEILPEGIAYRDAVESFTKFRLETVKNNEDEETIEKIIGCGQLEELIEQGNDELLLIAKYKELRIWEAPIAPE